MELFHGGQASGINEIFRLQKKTVQIITNSHRRFIIMQLAVRPGLENKL